ncbi:hypothetical protein [Sphingomonas sp. RT2P30]|uniref:hypothetical protein n=1 Tax=Parasphingomonas halimpatiens TaxID=3096162 RepID=UPI002FCBBADC
MILLFRIALFSVRASVLLDRPNRFKSLIEKEKLAHIGIVQGPKNSLALLSPLLFAQNRRIAGFFAACSRRLDNVAPAAGPG